MATIPCRQDRPQGNIQIQQERSLAQAFEIVSNKILVGDVGAAADPPQANQARLHAESLVKRQFPPPLEITIYDRPRPRQSRVWSLDFKEFG